MMRPKNRSNRTGGVYIAVLGSALVISLLGITALIGQRIQSRIITASTDIRQAQLNAATAVELGLLKMKTDGNWRSQLDAQSYLIKNRGLLSGGGATCSLQVFDAPSDATENADKPVKLVAIGRRGAATGDLPRTTAEQRMELVVEPRRIPHDCLKSGSGTLTNASTWETIFDHYGAAPDGVGTQISIDNLSDRTPVSPNFGRNLSFDDELDYWEDEPPGLPVADFDDPEPFEGHFLCLEVERNDKRAGAANRLRVSMLKPDTQYRVTVNVHAGFVFNILGIITGPRTNQFRISLITRYADNTYVTYPGTATQVTGGWQTISSDVRTPAWTQVPTHIYAVINSDHTSGTSHKFYVDNLDVYETDARFIYQDVLSPSVNTLYNGAPTNASEGKTHGVYWINCGGQKLVIERSRIFGTLLILNPGPGSRIAYGPYDWSPAIPGYPALLVNGDFTIQGTLAVDPRLFELENLVNYNPPGAPHRDYGVNANQGDSYESRIHGLIGVSGSLTYQNNPLLRGHVVSGVTPSGALSFSYQPDALLNPPPGFYSYRYDRRPTSVRKNVLP